MVTLNITTNAANRHIADRNEGGVKQPSVRRTHSTNSRLHSVETGAERPATRFHFSPGSSVRRPANTVGNEPTANETPANDPIANDSIPSDSDTITAPTEESEPDNPALRLSEQLTFEDDNQSTKDKRITYDSVGEKAWQVSSNTGTAGSLSYRRTKGILVSLGLINMVLIGTGRFTSTNNQIDHIHDEYQDRLVDGLVDEGPFKSFPKYLNDKIDGENGLFKDVIKAEEENNRCHAELFTKIHDKFTGMEDRYEALKNETLSYLQFQEELLQDINDNVAETEEYTVSQLTLMNGDIEEVLSAIESYKTYALAEYEALYENAQLNMANAESTLEEIQGDVDNARSRMEGTRARLERNNKGLRGRIIGPLLEKLNAIEETLSGISETSHSFVDLGKTPEEFAAELDAQFESTEELLRNTQRSVDHIIANAENGRITHETLATSLSESAQELVDYIHNDETIQDALEDTANIATLLDFVSNTTSEYLENKDLEGNAANITDQAREDFSELYEDTVEEVDNAFDGTLSEKARRMFSRYDTATDWLHMLSKGVQYLTYGYMAAVTGRRFINEMRNKPHGTFLQFFNIRLIKSDGGGTYAGRTQAGRDTDIPVRDLRRKRNCDVALKSITSSKFFLGMAGLFAVQAIINRAMAPAFNDIHKNSNDLINNLNGTLAHAKEGYAKEIKSTCIQTYDRKYRVDALNDHITERLQSAYQTNEKIRNAIDYLQEEEGLHCHFNNLNVTIQDDNRQVIEERCEAIAQEYVEDYFSDDVKKEQYIAKLHGVVDTVSGQDNKFQSRQKAEENNMIGLVLAHFVTFAIIHLNRYKNPDVLEAHHLAAKDRRVTKREIKQIPKVLAQINHTLHFHGLKLKEGDLLVVEPGFMKGFHPRERQKDDESIGEDVSLMGDSIDEFSDYEADDIEANKVKYPVSPDHVDITEAEVGDGIEVHFSVNNDNKLKIFCKNSAKVIKNGFNTLFRRNQQGQEPEWLEGSPKNFTMSERGILAKALADVGDYLMTKGIALKKGNIVVTDHDKMRRNAPENNQSIFAPEYAREDGLHLQPASPTSTGFVGVEVSGDFTDVDLNDDWDVESPSPRSRAENIHLDQHKLVEADSEDEGIEFKFSFQQT